MKRKLKKGLEVYDVCIIGGGPAGLVVASELSRSSLRVCVLEGGEERASRLFNTLKHSDSDKLKIKDNSRERVLGGSSTTWGGLSAPLDSIDFESRFEYTGWPISQDELTPFLEATVRYGFPEQSKFSLEESSEMHFENLQDKLFIAIRPPYNFASLKTCLEEEGVDIFLDATVTQLKEKRGAIQNVVCTQQGGDSFSVHARTFVLASGGIENSRLLLHSNVGNENDQVGRYFMNHPKGYAGVLRLRRSLPSDSLYLPRTKQSEMMYKGIRLSEEYQRSHRLLNSYLQFEPHIGLLQRYAYGIWRRLPKWLARWLEYFRPKILRIRWYADMEPESENRVVLSNHKDVFGVPYPTISYSLGERDEETLRALYTQLDGHVHTKNLGVLEGSAEEVIRAVTQDASHHMGGTRMGDDPKSSVVDKNCKVHSVSNLYVASSSVFPIAGCANPTMTIVALAIRLSNHISTLL